MAKLPVNEITLEGRIIRADYRKSVSKAGKPFLSVDFTLDVDGNQIKCNSFAMQYKADGETESSGYSGLMTIFNEANALYKTMREVGEEKSVEIEDETIVKDINEATAIKCSNYNGFKFCKFSENAYVSNGELVKNTRIEFAYCNRVDEDKREYKPQKDFELCGKVKIVPTVIEEGNFMQMVVIVPTYTEAYKDRPEKVELQEIKLVCHDADAFGYLEDNFTMGSIVYLNGEIVRIVERVESEVEVDENRGFGRTIAKQKTYNTNKTEYLEVLGGYLLEEDEIEMMREFDQDLWAKAKEEKEQKEAEMLEQNDKPKQKVGFGRVESKPAEKSKPALPFSF